VSDTQAIPEIRTVEVQVQGDHLQSLARARDAVSAISELVWNGLDEDATSVRVQLVSNNINGLESIRVVDNGNGMPYDDGIHAFGNLGGSLKRIRVKTPGGRLRHGKLGKGRFRAFALGERVDWHSRYRSDGGIREYDITGRRDALGKFQFTQPHATTGGTGVEVKVSNLDHRFTSLEKQGAVESITKHFALYLRQYPEVQLWYDGTRVDPSLYEERVDDIKLPKITLPDARVIDAELTIIEWNIIATEHALYLCDGNGFTLSEGPAGIHASGFSFTAYLKSDYFRELDDAGSLVLDELHPGLKAVLDRAKLALREHFRARAAEKATTVVEDWKRQDVYPYVGQPSTPLETLERQVFDVTAMQVHTYLPAFDDTDAKQKRFMFRLLKEALSTSPRSLQEIFMAVLDLPKEKMEDLARLLQQTSLEAILNAARMVANRLEFLAGLRALVFDPEVSKAVRERSQLHRLVAEHTWIFGEAFNISADDEELTTVLKRHVDAKVIELLGRHPVRRDDGTKAIIDLMLSRSIPQNDPLQREHLIVELKRPSVAVTQDAVAQTKSYAEAITEDARFRDTSTRWVFWVVSSEVQASVRRDSNQQGRPAGLLSQPEGTPYSIWVKSWGEIIQDNEARLKFVQERLQYQVTEVSGLDYLRETHAKYIPSTAGGAAPEPTRRRRGSPNGSPRGKKRRQ
jgi:hypothetical protein